MHGSNNLFFRHSLQHENKHKSFSDNPAINSDNVLAYYIIDTSKIIFFVL